MQNQLKERLRTYIQHHNPELLLRLQQSYSLNTYLEDKVSQGMPTVLKLLEENKPGYAIEELALNEITKDLRPSRFLFLQKVLREEFPAEYNDFTRAGVLTYETINLTEACRELLDNFPFTEDSEDDLHLRHGVIAKMSDYLN